MALQREQVVLGAEAVKVALHDLLEVAWDGTGQVLGGYWLY